MNRIRYIFILCYFLIIFNAAYAQKNSFDRIFSSDGEANLSVRQIIQDNNGTLWIATFSGLYKYEGDEYIIQHNFNEKQQINNDVTALLQDQNNNIWIGTNNGLSKYNIISEKLTTYYTNPKDSNSISSDKIRSLGMDKSGKIFIGTYDSGLNIYNQNTDAFIKVELNNSTENSDLYIKSILIGKNGKIWLGTFGDGLYCFSYKNSKIDSLCNFRMRDTQQKLTNNNIYCLCEDIDGRIAIGTRNGLNLFNPKTKSFSYYFSTPENQKGEMTNIFRSIKRDKNGKLWLGTWGGIILCNEFDDLNNNNFELLVHERNNNHTISHVQIMNFFEDNSGCIWIGTENGLNKYDLYQNQFEQITGNTISQLAEQTATAFGIYKNTQLILTLSHGLLQMNDNDIQFIPGNNKIEKLNEKLYSLLIDTDNNIWAGSYNGLLIKFNTTTQELLTFKHSERNTPIYALAEAENGNIIIGTGDEGLKYFNPKTNRFTIDMGLSNNVQINDILIDKSKRIWIATQFGIFKKDAETNSFEYFLPDRNEDILNPNIFNDISESAHGEIFVGGRNGLYQFNEINNTFETKTFKNATSVWVTNIQFDSSNNIWLNLNFNRIAKWEREINDLRFFSVNNGTRSSQYNRRGFFIDPNDQLYLSGFDQIYRFNTLSPVTNTFSPKPTFTKLVINNTVVNVGTKLNNQIILNENSNYQNEIDLNHKNKDFTLWFSSASYVNTRGNKYRYILHNYDKEWHIGSEKSAHYTNLSRGKYLFEVFSANNDGQWSNNSAKIFFRVKPSPFLSVVAMVIYLFVITILFFQIRKFILARIRLKSELLIERVKRDKEEKFNSERLRFYTNISHELRTPLTLIMGPIKQLISGVNSEDNIVKLQDLILNNSQRLLSLVNQLLDFRKSLYEGMKLKATHLNIVNAIESNIAAFKYICIEKSIAVSFTTESSVVNGWFDQEKIDIIIFNILSNAFKYTPVDGKIDIDLKEGTPSNRFPSGYIELKISDRGKGIPKHLHEKIFDRFYQVKDDSKNVNTGTGIGLSFVKSLVELHHGDIKVESVPGMTSFTLFLPLGNDLYNEDELFDFKRDANRRTKELFNNSFAKNEKFAIPKKIEKKSSVLIIEDNYELRDFLSGFLDEEYKVFVASNGLEGLEICIKENPNLVISDVMMDQMNGLEFCEKLKLDPKISHIPVILMTALSSVENKISGYKIGADDYITKPFEPELLRIRVRNILNNIEKVKKSFGSFHNVTPKELTLSNIDEIFLKKVIDIIDENIDNSAFDINILCKQVGVSSSQFYRKIKSITDLSPVEFIRTYRLKKAALLIIESNLSISEIAYKVGFNDALYFSKCFKKQFGTSPSKYS